MSNLASATRMAASPHRPRDRATYTAQTVPPSTVLITVEGELDAANTAHFDDYLRVRLGNTEKLVLDLSGVTFFAAEAFSAVHKVSVEAARQGVRCHLLTCAPVDRMLQICDPEHALADLRRAG